MHKDFPLELNATFNKGVFIPIMLRGTCNLDVQYTSSQHHYYARAQCI